MFTKIKLYLINTKIQVFIYLVYMISLNFFMFNDTSCTLPFDTWNSIYTIDIPDAIIKTEVFDLDSIKHNAEEIAVNLYLRIKVNNVFIDSYNAYIEINPYIMELEFLYNILPKSMNEFNSPISLITLIQLNLSKMYLETDDQLILNIITTLKIKAIQHINGKDVQYINLAFYNGVLFDTTLFLNKNK